MNLSETLKAIRAARSWSIRLAALSVHTTPATWYKWETGESVPGAHHARMLSSVHGIEPAELRAALKGARKRQGPRVIPGPRLVILESPFHAPDAAGRERFRLYALESLRDSIARGEAPLASHVLYTAALDDSIPEQRQKGIAAGLAWGRVAHATVVYARHGISPGMAAGIEAAREAGRPVEFRDV